MIAAVTLAAGCAASHDAPPTSPPAAPSVAPPAVPSTGPEMPRDLVGAPITLTGTVHAGDTCVVLEVEGQRWALFGPAAAELTDGRTATVRGRPMRLPSGCAADHALSLRG